MTAAQGAFKVNDGLKKRAAFTADLAVNAWLEDHLRECLALVPFWCRLDGAYLF